MAALQPCHLGNSPPTRKLRVMHPDQSLSRISNNAARVDQTSNSFAMYPVRGSGAEDSAQTIQDSVPEMSQQNKVAGSSPHWRFVDHVGSTAIRRAAVSKRDTNGSPVVGRSVSVLRLSARLQGCFKVGWCTKPHGKLRQRVKRRTKPVFGSTATFICWPGLFS